MSLTAEHELWWTESSISISKGLQWQLSTLVKVCSVYLVAFILLGISPAWYTCIFLKPEPALASLFC